MLAERRFDKGTIRSTESFNTKIKRFGRSGLDDEDNDDEFLSSVSASHGPSLSSLSPGASGARDDDDFLSFEMPNTRSKMPGGARQPGSMLKPRVVKQIHTFDME